MRTFGIEKRSNQLDVIDRLNDEVSSSSNDMDLYMTTEEKRAKCNSAGHSRGSTPSAPW